MTDPDGIQITRSSVLARARAGDAADFARLYGPLAYSIARKVGLRQSDAEDVMQQTMLELLQMLPNFVYDRARGSFKGLVKKIVRNRAVDSMRQRQRLPTQPVTPDRPAPNDEFDRMFEHEWLKTHLSAALERVRGEVHASTYQSFELAVLLEWPINQVAQTLGVSPNQVSQNKRRVFLRLREHLAELENEG